MIQGSDPAVGPSLLGQICEINPPKPKFAGLSDDTPVLFVPMAAVDEETGTITEAQQRTLGELRHKSYRTFVPGDVLFAKITPCMENGKSAIVPDIQSGIGFGSTEFHVLRPKPETDARFIWHLVRQQWFRDLAEEQMTGTVGQARVPSTFLDSFPLAFPDSATQSRIADSLDLAVNRTSHVADRLRRARLALARLRAATLAAACDGRLTSDWREAHPAASTGEDFVKAMQKSRRAQVGERLHPPASDEIDGELPESWAWTTIGGLVDVATGATPLRSNTAYYGGSVPWVTSAAVNAGVITESKETITDLALRETNAKVFPVGTLLLAMYGEGQTRGRVAELGISAATNQAVAALLFDDTTSAVRPYLRLFLLSNYERIRALSFGGVQPNLSLGVVRDTAVPIPPVDEQAVICEKANAILGVVDGLRRRIDHAEVSALRTAEALAAKAFHGELQTV